MFAVVCLFCSRFSSRSLDRVRSREILRQPLAMPVAGMAAPPAGVRHVRGGAAQSYRVENGAGDCD
jgi:hypothetical protein